MGIRPKYIQSIIDDYELIPYSQAPLDRYVKRVIKALRKCDPDSPLAEDLDQYEKEDSIMQGTLHEAIRWLKSHGKKE